MGGPKVPRPFPTEKKKDFIFLGPLAAGNAISSAPGASTQPSHFSPAVRATGTGTEEKGQVSTCCLQDFFYVARKIVNNGVVKMKFLDFFSRVLPFFLSASKNHGRLIVLVAVGAASLGPLPRLARTCRPRCTSGAAADGRPAQDSGASHQRESEAVSHSISEPAHQSVRHCPSCRKDRIVASRAIRPSL